MAPASETTSEHEGAIPRVNRKYIAGLAAFAAVVLVVGVFVRQKLHRDADAAPAPPSQAAAFQQLSQEGQLRRTAAYVAQRIGAAARFVEYVPAAEASGIRWARDTLLTTDSDHVVLALVAPVDARAGSAEADSVLHGVSLAPDTVRRDWLLVVGRDPMGAVLSATVLAGGRTPAHCGGRTVESYVLGSPLDPRLAGAGVFNVEAELLGMVVRCDGGVMALPARDVRRLLKESPSAQAAASPYGLGVRGDSLAEASVRAAGALLVDYVQRGGPADEAGLRVGDVLVAIEGQPATPDWARAMLEIARADTLVVTRRRGGSTTRVTLVAVDRAAARGDGFGIHLAAPVPRGVEISTVREGSAAARAGLRRGDRLVRVGDVDVGSADAADRLLASAAATVGPTLVVFERAEAERGVLLARGGSVRTVAPAAGARR
jgi:S1-C subfamily serine protease